MVEADIQTNIDFEEMAVAIEYTSEEGVEWISQMDIVDGKFVFEAQGNLSETKLRNARITLSYVDRLGSENCIYPLSDAGQCLE